MSAVGSGESGVLVVVKPGDHEIRAQAIALGDKYKRTLGFLPHRLTSRRPLPALYWRSLSKGRLWLMPFILCPGRLSGLTHLCVSGEARGRGLARLLITAISERHADRFG